MKILLFTTSLFFSINSYGQVKQTRMLDSLIAGSKLDSLKRAFPNIISPPSSYELAIYTAIEYFPELRYHTIKFKETKINTTMNARPTMSSLLFKRKSKRVYIVRMNNLKSRKEIITLNKVPFNAQVGVLGHEFNHFVDYSERGFFGVLGRGINYFSEKTKIKFEKGIDMRTINKGLAWQCYDFAVFVQSNENIPEEYKEFKRRTYLVPEDFLRLIGVAEDPLKKI